MSDLHARVEEARGHVATEWTPERQRRVRARFDRARLGRSRARRVGTALALAAACAVALVLAFRPRPAVPVAQQSAPAANPGAGLLFRLHDGTTVSSVARGTRVDTDTTTADRVVLRVVSGEARFEVAPQNGRIFRVLAGQVRVTVIGTRFTVSKGAEGVRVRVQRGHVQVDWPGGSTQLVAGQERLVPPASHPSAPPPAHKARRQRRTPPRRCARRQRRPRRGGIWHRPATTKLRTTSFPVGGARAVKDEPGDLLLAADVARLGGHPAAAVKYLLSVVSKHAGDARAPLAAFTLGRVLLDDLGRPRQAAQAFATALRLAPGGALAQDALAREVEAWSHAGETTLARQRAEQYLRQFPHGRRADAVRQFGGVE